MPAKSDHDINIVREIKHRMPRAVGAVLLGRLATAIIVLARFMKVHRTAVLVGSIALNGATLSLEVYLIIQSIKGIFYNCIITCCFFTPTTLPPQSTI